MTTFLAGIIVGIGIGLAFALIRNAEDRSENRAVVFSVLLTVVTASVWIFGLIDFEPWHVVFGAVVGAFLGTTAHHLTRGDDKTSA